MISRGRWMSYAPVAAPRCANIPLIREVAMQSMMGMGEIGRGIIISCGLGNQNQIEIDMIARGFHGTFFLIYIVKMCQRSNNNSY